MSKSQTDRETPAPKTPAPLAALGGWSSADWFCPSVLVDDEVVGFTLPKLGPGRKQSFRLVERTAARMPTKNRSTRGPQSPSAKTMPRRYAAAIQDVLEDAGATNQAAFRRATLLFDSSPILYFAEWPSARLKIRAANKLRATLVENHYVGCVLHLEDADLITMVWPSTETDITDFVTLAHPPYKLHAQFQQRPGKHATLSGGQSHESGAQNQERLGLRRANIALLQEIADLRAQIDGLRKSQSALGAMESLGLDDARLKSMLSLLHPDKHGNSDAANDAAKWINGLRDLLKRR